MNVSEFQRRQIRQLWDVQHGVIARGQLLELGVTDNDLRRMVRRHELFAARPGVYLSHNGPRTPAQQEWIALLAAWPAALCHESALPGKPPPHLHIAVGPHRSVDVPAGVVVHRMAHIDQRVDWRARPPRERIEHAVIDVMSKRIGENDVAGAYAVLTDACFRRTKPDRILDALTVRKRVLGRRMITTMLTDVRDGANSVLERGYLHDVERAHGLPEGERQRTSRATGRRTEQDVRYRDYDLLVELDGFSVHNNSASRDADARRDLAELAVSAMATARLTFGLVFNEPCQTAHHLETYFRRKGWTGEFVRCPRCP